MYHDLQLLLNSSLFWFYLSCWITKGPFTQIEIAVLRSSQQKGIPHINFYCLWNRQNKINNFSHFVLTKQNMYYLNLYLQTSAKSDRFQFCLKYFFKWQGLGVIVGRRGRSKYFLFQIKYSLLDKKRVNSSSRGNSCFQWVMVSKG